MPYTLLQTLNHLSASRRGRWDISLEFPKSPTPLKPKPRSKSKSSPSSSPSPSKISKPSSNCRLRVCRSTTPLRRKRSGKHERENLLMIFKVTGPGRDWNWYGENENCGMPRRGGITCGKRKGSDLEPDALERGEGCEFCGMLIDIFVEDLERDIPSLGSREDMDFS